MNLDGPPLLTILIPTRNRASFLLEALTAFAEAVANLGTSGQVEIVCADNWSTDNTPDIVHAMAARYPFVRYERQESECSTAERSLAMGVRFARGMHVWCFGDDDLPIGGALPILLRILEQHQPDFLLLNPKVRVDEETVVDYFSAADEFVPFGSCLALFRQLGMVSATTTISCLCFRRDRFDADIALNCADIFPVYSHTFALLRMLHDRTGAFLSTPLLTYRQNSAAAESERFEAWADSRGLSVEWIFTGGLIKLVDYEHHELDISYRDLAYFEEVELRKDNWTVQHNLLWVFICGFAMARLQKMARPGQPLRLSADAGMISSVVWLLVRTRSTACLLAAGCLIPLYLLAAVLALVGRFRPLHLLHRGGAGVLRAGLGLCSRYLGRVENRYLRRKRSDAAKRVQASKFFFGGPSLNKPMFYE